jgi:hypothetical protein
MCTLSFVDRGEVYLIGMNRDEQVARGPGGPPRIHEVPGARAIYPDDGRGGTWLAVNDHGVTFALLNWNLLGKKAKQADPVQSRGRLIPLLTACRTLSAAGAVLCDLDLNGTAPFRLLAFSSSAKQIREWCWNSGQLHATDHPWQSNHWFSSSLSDEKAERVRRRACASAWKEKDCGSPPWLLRLHSSHESNGFGPCVHRPEVRTLSYSLVFCGWDVIELSHSLDSPCHLNAGASSGKQNRPKGDPLLSTLSMNRAGSES